MWILMFATLVASLGLSVDSTAVIIGAMLISPLMGPIMGFGLSLGINDFELMNRSLRNFGFMTATAIVTATLFFLVIPISGAQSELLARTQPTIFDVMIAFFGGAAGVVAYTRKDRTVTVISGVAIATALMPPLCTAGYGIATGQWRFFGGALYLFLINAIFIALSTYVIVRALKYSPKVEVERRTERRLRRAMWVVIVITILPSVFIAFRLIDRSMFESNVSRFVEAEFRFDGTAVIEREIDNAGSFDRAKSPRTVTLMLMGEALDEAVIESIRSRMPMYDLEGTTLVVNQASGTTRLDFSPLQQGYSQLLDEKNRQIAELQRELVIASRSAGGVGVDAQTIGEFRAIAPAVDEVSISRHPVWRSERAGEAGEANGRPADTLLVCIVKPSGAGALSADELGRMESWLRVKHKIENVKIYVE
jgi:uncharacterized hydrophobic protein (TIGR00271 family)